MREFFHLAHSARMSADDAELAEVMLYGEIVQDYGKWYKEYYPNDKCASDFDKEIKELREGGAKKLLLRINSPGGIVFEAVAMRSILANAGFEDITVRIEGLCASAATIPATLPTAHVQISPGSEFMIHNPWTMAWGFAEDLEHEAEHLRNMEKTIRGFYTAKSGQEDDQVKAWMDKEEWMTAEQAVERGFCDELLNEGKENAEPAAACVGIHDMGVMCGIYKHVPKEIHTFAEGGTVKNGAGPIPGDDAQEYILPPDKAKVTAEVLAKALAAVAEKSLERTADALTETMGNANKGSNEDPVAGFSSVNNSQEGEPTMEIKDITRDQLLAENPALAEEIRNSAIQAERERMEEIDALCVPGYEAMAEEAKKNGTSAVDFQKAVVKAMKEKGNAHIAQRQQETAPAANVSGGSASDTATSEDEEIKNFAKEMAGYACESKNESMF